MANRDPAEVLRHEWSITLSTLSGRLAVVVLAVAVLGFLSYRTWWVFLGAWVTRSAKPDPAVYELALQYDPENADYHFALGQIYNYSTQHLNPERARQEYEAAARLNPDRSSHWIELSKYYEQEGDIPRSRHAMEMALRTDPNYAQTHWAAANLYARLGDLGAADAELRRSADLEPAYTTQVLDLVWRLYEDPRRIVEAHLPNTLVANRDALRFFVSHDIELGAELVWYRLAAFQTRLQDRIEYVDYLVKQGKPHDAWRVFAAGLRESGQSPPFYNAGFESGFINVGFDWRNFSWGNAEVRQDTATVKEGLASAVVIFNGDENVDYKHLWHWLPVEKGRAYILKFSMKTDSLTTNEGVYVEVDGKTSEKKLGTNYWQDFAIPFVASSDLVTVTLRRQPSQKFDNRLKGRVWLDAFSLSPQP